MSTSTAIAIQPGTYAVDPAHSEISFRVRHLLTKVTGHFREFSGAITVDPSDLERSTVELRINAASIDSATADRDAHLRSADFFDVEKFPHLTFRSERVKQAGEGFVVTGPLTIHGVARTIDLPVTYLGTMNDPWGNAKAGFEATVRLNRKDFGLTWNAALETGGFLVGDDIDVTLNIQAALQK